MRVEIFQSLPPQAKKIREQVFIVEQGFQTEFDEIDHSAIHFTAFDESDAPIAVCRVFQGAEKGVYILGRLAVVKKYRGRRVGSWLVKKAEAYVHANGGTELRLHAQCRISDFYQALGFSPFGEVDDDEGCPHIWMKKEV